MVSIICENYIVSISPKNVMNVKFISGTQRLPVLTEIKISGYIGRQGSIIVHLRDYSYLLISSIITKFSSSEKLTEMRELETNLLSTMFLQSPTGTFWFSGEHIFHTNCVSAIEEPIPYSPKILRYFEENIKISSVKIHDGDALNLLNN
jgi:hypothetical protein